MSKDIRSFFAPVKGKSSSISTEKQTNTSKSETKKRVYNVSESDEDDDFVAKPQPKKSKSDAPKTPKSEKKATPKRETKPAKPVDVKNFFGDSPVQQKPQTLIKKSEASNKPEVLKNDSRAKKRKKGKPELENHFDDDFEATLSMLDDDALGITPPKVPKKEEVTPAGKNEQRSVDKSTEKESKLKDVKKETPEKKSDDVTPSAKKTPKEKDVPPSELDTKRKANAQAYQRFLSRGGPRNPGSKSIPEGAPNCLAGKCFVITGVLESLERDEASELIQKYGGRVTSSVSKKTSYIILGDEPGESKVKKAEDFKIPQIFEDGLLDMIRKSMDGKKKKNDEPVKSEYFTNMKEETKKNSETKQSFGKSKSETPLKPPSSKKLTFPKETDKKVIPPVLNNSEDSGVDSMHSSESFPPISKLKLPAVPLPPGESNLWVDKYKPKSTKFIIGQTGDKSNVKKLTKWLTDWYKHHGSGVKKKTGQQPRWGGDDGVVYKAALLSGPPGVGKTTSVNLVCKELGLDVVEFNASDTRSKRLLSEQVAELLSSKTIRAFCSGGDVKEAGKHVLVMDEVDGMAGNEDRGGVQELIQLIKKTRTPIICMCNDRSHPKMRSLVNYCFDLRFSRPRVEQIKGAMMSICFKEGLHIPGDALVDIITNANQDVRQVIHNLSMWCVKNKTLSGEQAHIDSLKAKKSLKMGPWDVVRSVFSQSDREKMSLRDKEDLFFQDYNLGPLFVQDTYIRVKPFKAKGNKIETLGCLSRAAESLTWGDVIERKIRSQNAWGLLPAQAYLSSVIPGYEMSGHVMGQITFPAWLGKNSKRSRIDRITQELHIHTRLKTSGSKRAMTFDYAQPLRDAILRPLIKDGSEGVPAALEVMKCYNLLREDLDSLIEIAHWPGKPDPYASLDSKIKAAFTRAYNKDPPATPYAVTGFKKAKTDSGFEMDGEGEEAEEGEGEDEADDISADAMIKKGKPKKEPVKKQKDSAAAGPSEKKPKAKGKGSKTKH